MPPHALKAHDDVDHVGIYVNATAVDDLLEDINHFKHIYLNKTGEEIEQLRWALANAFMNCKAKLILNFGSTVAPVLKYWAKLWKKIQVNDGCDQECAVDCFEPGHGDLLHFDS